MLEILRWRGPSVTRPPDRDHHRSADGRGGYPWAIDVARNEMASDALHDGFESILFVDADLGFHCRDALRLLARPEPVVAALYAKKGPRELTSIFAEGVAEVILGPD